MATKKFVDLLGKKVKDQASGFTGYAIARTDQLNGNVQYSVQPRVKADAAGYPDGVSLDHQLLVATTAKALTVIAVKSPRKFELGAKVRSVITGVEGTITDRTTFLNGCEKYTVVTLKTAKEGPVEIFVDKDELDLVGDGLAARFKALLQKVPTGGPATPMRRV